MTEDPFLEWLDEQEYWVRASEIKQEWPEAQFDSFRDASGICDENGKLQYPRRDWRKRYEEGTADAG